MKLGVRIGILGDFEERLEEVCSRRKAINHSSQSRCDASQGTKERENSEEALTSNDVLEILDHTSSLVDIVETRDLDEPSDVVRDEFVVDDPFGELVPFVDVSGEQEKEKESENSQ